MEQMLVEFGMKDGIFVALFIWLLVYTFKKADQREDKLFKFLDDMKVEFARLVGSYDQITRDVSEIKNELHNKADKN